MIRVHSPPFQEPLRYHLREEEARHRAVQKIALEIFFELVAALGVAAVACAFAATPAAVSFIIGGALIQVIANLAIRLIGKALENRQLDLSGPFSWATSLNFAWGTGIYKQTLIHEMGHALAATAVYRDARARISLLPYFGGNTHFFPQHLSSFGQKLGADRAIVLVTTTGPGLTLLISAFELSAGLFIFEKHPKLGRCLILMACFDFILHARYAISALRTPASVLSHDFVRLSSYGRIQWPPLSASWRSPSSSSPRLCNLQNRVHSMLRNCSSDRIAIPNSFALSYLEPGSAPTKT